MIDRLIGLSTGLTLFFGSVSGLKCVNGPRSTGPTIHSDGTPLCGSSSKSCSRTNMNLALTSMGVTGGLLMYKHLSK